jgi:hypothetical protein
MTAEKKGGRNVLREGTISESLGQEP